MPIIAHGSDTGDGAAASDGRAGAVAGLRPAGLLRRLGAMLYDSLVVLALFMLTLFVLTGLNRFEAVQGPVVNGILFLELYGFFAYFWTRRGQTVGMLAWRLQVSSIDHRPITLGQATRRFLGALAGLACLGLGYAWILLDPHQRSWSDLLSRSRVLYLPKPAS